jgi:sec-independent protein translocase protein TatA
MGGLAPWHIILLLLVVVLLFGRGKVSDLMGDVAKGIKSFKKGLADDEPAPAPPVKTIDGQNTVPLNSTEQTKAS